MNKIQIFKVSTRCSQPFFNFVKTVTGDNAQNKEFFWNVKGATLRKKVGAFKKTFSILLTGNWENALQETFTHLILPA